MPVAFAVRKLRIYRLEKLHVNGDFVQSTIVVVAVNHRNRFKVATEQLTFDGAENFRAKELFTERASCCHKVLQKTVEYRTENTRFRYKVKRRSFSVAIGFEQDVALDQEQTAIIFELCFQYQNASTDTFSVVLRFAVVANEQPVGFERLFFVRLQLLRNGHLLHFHPQNFHVGNLIVQKVFSHKSLILGTY